MRVDQSNRFLEKKSTNELKDFIKAAKKILDKKKTRSRRKVIFHTKAKIQELIQYIDSEGFDPDEILLEVLSASFTSKTKRKSNKKRLKIPPKYRNPDNASETWTGRGRAPLWARPYKRRGELDKILIRVD